MNKIIESQQDLKKTVTDYSSVISLLSTNVSRVESGQQSMIENIHEILGIVKKQSQAIQAMTNSMQDILNRISNLESGVSTTTTNHSTAAGPTMSESEKKQRLALRNFYQQSLQRYKFQYLTSDFLEDMWVLTLDMRKPTLLANFPGIVSGK